MALRLSPMESTRARRRERSCEARAGPGSRERLPVVQKTSTSYRSSKRYLPSPPGSEADVDLPKIWDDPPIVVTVSRKDVESSHAQATLDSLFPLLRNAEEARSSLGRVVLTFEGFGKNAGTIWFDEVWQVAEGRSFVATLDQEFPFWFFLDRKSVV